MRFLIILLLLVLGAGALWYATRNENTGTPVYKVKTVRVLPHDPKAFTQGLLIEDGKLYESTGQRGESTVRLVDLETGKVLQKTDLSPSYFGEGLTAWKDKLVQITWQAERALYYDRETLELLERKRYDGEGWGLTTDGTHLIMSDGSNSLRFMDPDTFKEVRRVRVKSKYIPISKLNELEYIKGEVWANVWKSSYLARIDPETGQGEQLRRLAWPLQTQDRR